MHQQQFIGVTIVVLSALLLGLYPSFIRVLYADGVGFAAILFITTAVRALLPALEALRRGCSLRITRQNIRPLLTIATFQFLSLVTLFGAFKFMIAPLVMIIFFSYPLVLACMSALTKDEHISKWLWFCLLLTLVGLIPVIGVGVRLEMITPAGFCLTVIALLATATRMFLIGKNIKPLDPSVFSAQAFGLAAIPSLVLWLAIGGALPQNLQNWGILAAACGVLTLGGTFGTFWGIKLLGAVRYSLLMNVEPVAGVIVAALLIGEVLTLTQYVGTAIVIGTIVLYQGVQFYKEQKWVERGHPRLRFYNSHKQG